MNKYEYLLDHYLQQGVVNVVLPVTREGNFFNWLNVLLRLLRFRIWLVINALSYKKFKILFSYETMASEDTVFAFFHDNFASTPVCCDRESYIAMIYQAKCSFLVHLNHYVYNVEKGSKICSRINKLSFVAETNLHRYSSFFEEQFNWYRRDVLVLPFCVQDRFSIKPEVSRTFNAVATGAVTFRLNEPAFQEFFGTDLLQPQRKYLLDHGEAITNLDVSIAEWTNYVPKSLWSTLFLRVQENVSNWKLKYFVTNIPRENFYNLDLVAHYNSYCFVLCPAELIGLPGMGAFEAMACGAILIDDGNKFYEDYGLYANEHFITYDGTIDNLKTTLDLLAASPNSIDALRAKSLDVVNKTMRKMHCATIFESHVFNI